jgi:hypothetical protein
MVAIALYCEDVWLKLEVGFHHDFKSVGWLIAQSIESG